MNVRGTSLEAYQALYGAGAVRTQAYRILRTMQAGRDYMLNELEQETGIRINAVAGRVNDLKTRGFIVEGKPRLCGVSGNRCIPVLRPVVMH